MPETRGRFKKRIKSLMTPDHLRVVAKFIETGDEAIGNAAGLYDADSGHHISNRVLAQIVMG